VRSGLPIDQFFISNLLRQPPSEGSIDLGLWGLSKNNLTFIWEEIKQVANPTFQGSPKAPRVKNFGLFWDFLSPIWGQIGSLLRVFSALDLGPFSRGLILG
jgi:hypothetical protein